MKKLLSIVFIITLFTLNSSLFAQHKLLLNFKDMDVHAGQTVGIQVVDKMTSQLVAFQHVHNISAEFSTELYALLKNHSYIIQFYADHNGNGMYDDPPADHTYHLELNNVQGDTVLNFSHHANFSTLDWKPDYDYHLYQGEWTGRWHNLTYDTTDSLTFMLTIDEESQKISGVITTQGAFGNPDQVTFNFESEFDSQADTLKMAMPMPWQGEIVMTDGSISGTVSDSTLFGVGITLKINGNFAISQFIATYEMSGAFTANGVMWANREFSLPTRVLAKDVEIPQQFKLANYPNPFNPTTTISFELQQADDIQLHIFNINGQWINTLVNQQIQSGKHQVIWNATDADGKRVTSGMYFYHLRSSTDVQTGKMMLLQ